MTRAEAFLARVTIESSGCWIWDNERNKHGLFGGILAHRASWILLYGPIPTRQLILHSCVDTKGCVNPEHLRPGTSKENRADEEMVRPRKGRRRGTGARGMGQIGKDFQVNFRMAAAHLEIITKAATEANMTLTSWLTIVALEGAGASALGEQLYRVAIAQGRRMPSQKAS